MTDRRLVLCCDAAAQTGLGHWVRSSALADELAGRGWKVTVVHWPDVEPQVLADTRAREWHCMIRNANTLSETLPEPGGVVLVDSYRVDAEWIARLRRPGRTVLLVDDLADRGALDVDVLVNQNLGADEFGYSFAGRRPVSLLGPSFAMLRPQFAHRRAEALERLERQPRRPERVFVMMGGNDATAALAPVIRACLAAFPWAIVRAVVPPTSEIGDELAGSARFDGIDPTPDIAEQMVGADLVVSAGGTSVWELCATARPFGIVVVADNQQDAARRLADMGAAVHLADRPVEPDRLADRLRTTMSDPVEVVRRARTAAGLVDGLGCRRVADAVEAAAAAPPERLGTPMPSGSSKETP